MTAQPPFALSSPSRQIRTLVMRRHWHQASLLVPTIKEAALIDLCRVLLAPGEALPWHPVRRIIWLVELRRPLLHYPMHPRCIQLSACILREVRRLKRHLKGHLERQV